MNNMQSSQENFDFQNIFGTYNDLDLDFLYTEDQLEDTPNLIQKTKNPIIPTVKDNTNILPLELLQNINTNKGSQTLKKETNNEDNNQKKFKKTNNKTQDHQKTQDKNTNTDTNTNTNHDTKKNTNIKPSEGTKKNTNININDKKNQDSSQKKNQNKKTNPMTNKNSIKRNKINIFEDPNIEMTKKEKQILRPLSKKEMKKLPKKQIAERKKARDRVIARYHRKKEKEEKEKLESEINELEKDSLELNKKISEYEKKNNKLKQRISRQKLKLKATIARQRRLNQSGDRNQRNQRNQTDFIFDFSVFPNQDNDYPQNYSKKREKNQSKGFGFQLVYK
ncbi:transcription factor ap-1 [Anaeramoeba flamelloides]|uniref:Transcription factor ap-1 n=1 Tax=Anaeramoeba flamelloides TaxID=1746091 RepID=A0AAV7Z3F0_9EUKA|nr:transcription factor ap-1 [Anaeramoeba flamelloides]